MSQPMTVKVSSRYQIAVPRIARERLNIKSGDSLLVDVQDGLFLLTPSALLKTGFPCEGEEQGIKKATKSFDPWWLFSLYCRLDKTCS